MSRWRWERDGAVEVGAVRGRPGCWRAALAAIAVIALAWSAAPPRAGAVDAGERACVKECRHGSRDCRVPVGVGARACRRECNQTLQGAEKSCRTALDPLTCFLGSYAAHLGCVDDCRVEARPGLEVCGADEDACVSGCVGGGEVCLGFCRGDRDVCLDDAWAQQTSCMESCRETQAGAMAACLTARGGAAARKACVKAADESQGECAAACGAATAGATKPCGDAYRGCRRDCLEGGGSGGGPIG